MENSGCWKPTSAIPAKKLAGSCELTNAKLASGGASAFVSFYDGTGPQDVIDANLRWVLDSSTQDPDQTTFAKGLIFYKGVYAVCEQGFDQNPVVCIATRNYSV